MSTGEFDTPKFIVTVEARMAKILACEALGRFTGTKWFDSGGNIEDSSFIENKFTLWV